MKAEIITIGDEILIGQIVDTNSAFLGEELHQIGVEVCQISSIQDDPSHIVSALEAAFSRADLILFTGGLGPTNDDVTKNTLCHYFKDDLVHHAPTWEHICDLFAMHFNRVPKEVHKLQALVPSKAEILRNRFGTAPGMWFEKRDKVVVSMPGVPLEMKTIVQQELVPRLVKRYELPSILHHTIIVYDIGESDLAERITDWEQHLVPPFKLAYLPSYGLVRLRISAIGVDTQRLEQQMYAYTTKLEALLDGLVFTKHGEGRLEYRLQELCIQNQCSLATAESFTGGKISQLLTSIPGSSTYFKGGVVSYATQTKIEVLGVPKQLIELHTVVSAAVAEAMASQVRKLMKTDYAIATTGNAGPSKGDSDAEIGTVFIAIATPKKVYSQKYQFGKSRERVVNKGLNKALELMVKEILKL
ncbi:MAG: CinA family nicotinamide mononucleotide deamidase-related protein [Flavobacteriaceae bacterium]|nr:CinA family nicotinamide mononucleotide deamidase-related protein [Flavobacteriaceae bacterium]